VTYTASIVLDPSQFARCNCANCIKQGKLTYLLHPKDFTLLTPSSLEDETVFHSYRYGRKAISQITCGHCKIYLWGIGIRERYGEAVLFGLNANTLDGIDWSDKKWKAGEGRFYYDGKGDFQQGTRSEPFEWGCW
jgi:hypothetical protein